MEPNRCAVWVLFIQLSAFDEYNLESLITMIEGEDIKQRESFSLLN